MNGDRATDASADVRWDFPTSYLRHCAACHGNSVHLPSLVYTRIGLSVEWMKLKGGRRIEGAAGGWEKVEGDKSQKRLGRPMTDME